MMTQPNIGDADITEKISQVEGSRWEKSQIQAAQKGETTVIYGACGVARYFVEEDGEVKYSAFHGTETQKAKEAGFSTIWE